MTCWCARAFSCQPNPNPNPIEFPFRVLSTLPPPGIALLNEQGTDAFDGAMKLAFKVYDSSGEGRGLCKQDLARLLRRVCDVEMSDALVEETFKAADKDSDGLLSVEEFLVLAREHRNTWASFKTSLFR